MRAHRVRLASACFASAAVLALSCSSAPKPPDAVFEVKNKAAEYAKLGDQYMAEGKFSTALGYYEEAQKAGASVDDLIGVSASRSSMGRAYAAAGQADDARREYGTALEYAVMAGSGAAQSAAKSGLGELDYAAGRAEAALALFEEAVSLASPKDAGGGGKALAVALHDRAVAQAALGRASEAKADLAKAQELNLKDKRWAELGSNRYVLASILAGEGALAEALAAALGALEADKRAESAMSIPPDLAAAAGLSSRLGRDADAWGYWRRSFETGMAVDDAASVRKALGALVDLAGKLGKAEDKARYSKLLERLDDSAMRD
jgi:tetratricopeptide (TPR) repeat protein